MCFSSRSLSRDCFYFFSLPGFTWVSHFNEKILGVTRPVLRKHCASHRPTSQKAHTEIYSTFKHGKAAKTPIGGLQAVRRDFKNNHETKQQITVARQRQEGGGTYEKIQAMFLRVRQDSCSIKELPRRPFCKHFEAQLNCEWDVYVADVA
jgi:hypothetical protein